MKMQLHKVDAKQFALTISVQFPATLNLHKINM